MTHVGADTLDGRLTTTRPVWQTAVAAIVWSVTILSLAGIWILLGQAEPGGELATTSSILGGSASLAIIALATGGAVVVLRGDSPRYGLIMMASGATSAVVTFTAFYGLHSLEADVPWADAAVWIQDLWMVEQMMLVLLLPALLPDGTVASPGWRRPFRIVLTGWVVLIVMFTFAERPASNFFLGVDGPVPSNPTGFLPVPIEVLQVSWLLVGLASVIVGFGSLTTRWRRGRTPR